MPIKYENYGCRFKCGIKHRRSFKRMQDHEENCWYNPQNKTCITCEYGEIIKDYCDHTEMEGCPTEHWKYRECNETTNQDAEFNKNSFGEKMIPIINCSKWKSKEGEQCVIYG